MRRHSPSIPTTTAVVGIDLAKRRFVAWSGGSTSTARSYGNDGAGFVRFAEYLRTTEAPTATACSTATSWEWGTASPGPRRLPLLRGRGAGLSDLSYLQNTLDHSRLT